MPLNTTTRGFGSEMLLDRRVVLPRYGSGHDDRHLGGPIITIQARRSVSIVVSFQEECMPLRKVLRADLNEARKAGDSELATLARTLISAIDNAEAVELSDAPEGSSEVPRRRLSDDEIMKIVLDEGAELRAAAEDYEQHGRNDEAGRLRALSIVADRYAHEMPRGRT